MSELTHVIRARTVEKLRKEAISLKKSLKITHHEALDIAARKFDFNNWEHLQKSASATSISEEPYRNGFVIAMDVKDATEHPPSKANRFIQDDQIYALIYMDFFTQRKYEHQKDLTEDDRYFLEDLEINYVYFRYDGQIPNTVEKAFKLAEKEFFFPPLYIWLKGKWYDHFGLFDYEESLKELKEEIENDRFL
jgi:hypothetical protein